MANQPLNINNYFDYYQAKVDPFDGHHRVTLKKFAPTAGNFDGDDLLQEVMYYSGVYSLAYLMVSVSDVDQPVVSVLHSLHRHIPLTGTSDPIDVAFLGDFRAGNAQPPQVVQLPDDPFEKTDATKALPAEEIEDALNQSADLQLLPAGGDKRVRTTFLMYLPQRFVPILLGMPVLTPRTVWKALYPVIAGEGDEAQITYKPLVNWMRVALTKAPPIVSLTPCPSLVSPPNARIDAVMIDKLKRDIPRHFHHSDPAVGATTAAVHQLTRELVRVENERVQRESSSKNKTPTQFYGASGAGIICRLAHCVAADLPSIYALMANAPKKMERHAIEEALRLTADRLGLLDYIPEATTGLTRKIASVQFTHHDIDDLDAGIHPFITCHRSIEQRTTLNNYLTMFDEINKGRGGSLIDIQLIKQQEQVVPPTTADHTTYTLKSFRVLVHTLLGENHALTKSFDNFLVLWERRIVRLQERLRGMADYSLVLRWLQIRISNWFNEQVADPGVVPPPVLDKVIHKIMNHESWAPQLPAKFAALTDIQDLAQGLYHAPTPAPPASQAASQPPRVPPPVAAPAREQVRNPHYYNQSLRDLGVPLSTVRENASKLNLSIPTRPDGTERCLSFHCLGFCWSNCNRKSDHVKLQESDKVALKAFTDKCFCVNV